MTAEAQQQTGGDCVSHIVRLSDVYWKPWLAALLELAALHGITTSDDADLWWDDFGAGKTPQESMDGFLASDEGAQFRDSLPNSQPNKNWIYQTMNKTHNTMSPEEQRIAIAQACGWTGFNPDNIPDCLQYTARAPSGKWGLIPDYLDDLNAMHAAEKVILAKCCNDPQADLWIDYLANLLMASPLCLREHATATQRAEAFGITLNLWKP